MTRGEWFDLYEQSIKSMPAAEEQAKAVLEYQGDLAFKLYVDHKMLEGLLSTIQQLRERLSNRPAQSADSEASE